VGDQIISGLKTIHFNRTMSGVAVRRCDFDRDKTGGEATAIGASCDLL